MATLTVKNTVENDLHLCNILDPVSHYKVSLKEYTDSVATNFYVYSECNSGNCSCVHKIGKCYSQLRPCRLFCKVFLRGHIDPDWSYTLRGVVFGFHIINPSCSAAKPKEIRPLFVSPPTHTPLVRVSNKQKNM